jgi:sulfide dehydrogenase [flavocytochrome c] flavoprotein subunit
MTRDYKRRDFIRALGAGAAAAAAPAILSGCATGPDEPRKPIGRVIVIGAGYGGATAAKYIRMWSERRIEVFLIDRNTQFVSCPLSNLVLGGTRSIDSLTHSYDRLRGYGVQVLRDDVTGINLERKRVQLKRIEDLPYDRLIVAPGIDFMFDQIPGLNNPEAQKVVLQAWKAGPETVELRKQLEAMPDGGVFILAIPKVPYRCPPGPYERACQVAFYFKQAKPKSKVLVLDGNEDIVSKKGLFLAAWNDLYKGIIEYQPSLEVKDVDVKGMVVKTEFDSFKGSVLNVLPPQAAGQIAHQAKLVTAANRWCGVNWETMESVAVPGVHVIGDATLSGPAMPKSASMANNHAKICASAIVALMTGRPVNPLPIINNTCYSYVSDREAMRVTQVYRYDAAQKVVAPVQGAGGVSSQRTEIEKQFADAWARNIWSDTLG